jgi:hypothetical protein
MKTKLLVAVVMGVLALPALATVDVAVDRAGAGGADIVVSSLDWNVGNGLAIGAVPLAAGTDFQVRVQNNLAVFNLAGGGTATPAPGREWTLVGVLPEHTAAVTGAFPTGFASFVLGPVVGPATPVDGVSTVAGNTIQIWESAADSSNLAGTGFANGTLILEATVTSLTSIFSATGGGAGTDLDQFLGGDPPIDDYPAIDTVTGIGVTDLVATVNFTDPNFFTDFGPGPDSVALTLFNTSQLLPFNQAEPSALFLGYAPSIGPVNGLSGPDFQFQLDANQSFNLEVIPEPVTAALGMMGLSSLALALLRRRTA